MKEEHMAMAEDGVQLEDLCGPMGWLVGMRNPHGWVQMLTATLTGGRLAVRATCGRLPSGLAAIRLSLPAVRAPLPILLVPHPDRVRLVVGIAAWTTTPLTELETMQVLTTLGRGLLGVATAVDPTPVLLILPSAPDTGGTAASTD